ncbi:MAG: hypothetical protein KDE46_23390, partial [Caldilineaceae bacterium]|nr:hypothetical protein [Caldilineaceae bacterium]
MTAVRHTLHPKSSRSAIFPEVGGQTMFGTFLIAFILFNIVSTLIVLGACAVSGANEHIMEKALLDKIEQNDVALQDISSARQ